MAKFCLVDKIHLTLILRIFVSIFLIISLTHCASYDFSHRIVQQGNLLPQAKVARLKLGMHKEDVATLLGTSLLSTVFNDDKWDYAYTWRRGTGPLQIRRLYLSFSPQGRLVRITSNILVKRGRRKIQMSSLRPGSQ